MTGTGKNLHNVAVVQRGLEGHQLAVHPCPVTVMANFGVDRISEVHGRGPARKALDLPLRREGVHLLRVEVQLHHFQELPRVPHLLLPFHDLAQPLNVGILPGLDLLPLLVLPVGGDPFLGDAVHFRGPDLDLEGLSLVAHHRGV